jgi:hypothetical protein
MSESPTPRRSVPAFTPVPLRPRKDGWSPMRQADFLGRLAETGCVTAAARHVGMTRESAYRLRAKPGAGSFAAAWDAIVAAPPASLPKVTDSLLMHRAFYGTLKPLMRGGRHVATRHSPDTGALLSLYRQAAPLRRGGGRRPKGHG